ncbi:unnamed protein product [Ectocarpus sp. 13 AM-2016]
MFVPNGERLVLSTDGKKAQHTRNFHKPPHQPGTYMQRLWFMLSNPSTSCLPRQHRLSRVQNRESSKPKATHDQATTLFVSSRKRVVPRPLERTLVFGTTSVPVGNHTIELASHKKSDSVPRHLVRMYTLGDAVWQPMSS